MPSSRPFVPIDSFERLRRNLKPNLADCRRIREVWEIRRRNNELRDSGFSVSLANQCTNDLRAIAEEEARCALGLLDHARKAIEATLPQAQEYRDCIVESESRGGDLATLPADVKSEVDAHDAAIADMKEVLAAIDAANQE